MMVQHNHKSQREKKKKMVPTHGRNKGKRIPEDEVQETLTKKKNTLIIGGKGGTSHKKESRWKSEKDEVDKKTGR